MDDRLMEQLTLQQINTKLPNDIFNLTLSIIYSCSLKALAIIKL